MIKKYFLGSIWVTAIALALSILVGYIYGGQSMAITYLISAIMLSVLEVSVSLDNAIVNAKVLKTMEEVWRRRFLTWGMFVAVFGMRLVFPLAIVSIAGGINPWDALNIAMFNPIQYEKLMNSVNLEIMAYGGAFLLMVFSSHFIDHEKEVHWIPVIGPLLSRIGKHGTARLFVPILLVLIFSGFLKDKANVFLVSAVWGIITYLMVDGLGEMFNIEGAATSTAKTGVAGFMYLEVVDASFSLDGVIAAFAITNNFLIIMLGLTVGAMFVRSMTIMLVDKGTLSTFRYLEDGAFWGIGWLVIAMFLHTIDVHIGEINIALGAAVAIGASVWHSMIVNKREALAGTDKTSE